MHTTEGTQSKRRNGGARWEHAGMGCALHSPREVRYARTAPMAGIWRGMAAGKRGGAAALAARAVVRGHGPTIPRTSDGRRGPTEPSAMIATSVLNRSTVYSVIVLGRETVREGPGEILKTPHNITRKYHPRVDHGYITGRVRIPS
jgi:hypothetical protein